MDMNEIFLKYPNVQRGCWWKGGTRRRGCGRGQGYGDLQTCIGRAWRTSLAHLAHPRRLQTETETYLLDMDLQDLYWLGEDAPSPHLREEGRKEGDGLEVMGAPSAGLEVLETSGGYGDLDLQHL